jgi:hypothetical protein
LIDGPLRSWLFQLLLFQSGKYFHICTLLQERFLKSGLSS